MSENKSKKGSKAPIIKKVISNKSGPGDALSVTLTSQTGVGAYLRLFVGPNTGTPRETVLHRPIGVTDLDGDEWVATEPGDIPLLLARLEDPNKAKIAAARADWLLEQLIAAELLIRSEDGACVYNLEIGASTRKAFFDRLKADFERSGGKLKDFNLSDAISRSSDPRAAEETKIRNLLTNLGRDADARFASTYRTVSGPNRDRPQVPLIWAKGLPLSELADQIFKFGLAGPPTKPTAVGDEGEATSVQGYGPMVAGATDGGAPQQWCFLPKGLDRATKKKVKDAMAVAKNDLETKTGKQYAFIVSEKKG